MADPAVSIIICTSNRAAALRETLNSLNNLGGSDDLPYEIVVVDNNSTDETASVAQSTSISQTVLRYIHEPNQGLSHARNRGMAEARGQVFLFTDDDVRAPVDWVTKMSSPILSGNASVVAGGVKIAPHLERPWMGPFHRMMLASTEVLEAQDIRTMVGANMAFSRDVLKRVPAFDTELGAGTAYYGEEALFAAQLHTAGFAFASALNTVVTHHFDESRLSRAAFLRRMETEGKTQAYIAHHWKHETPKDFWKFRVKDLLAAFHWPSPDKSEGITAKEMAWVHDVSFVRQYAIERTRPRNYEKHGLVKLQHGKP